MLDLTELDRLHRAATPGEYRAIRLWIEGFNAAYPELAAELRTLRATVEQMRPVVEAAVEHDAAREQRQATADAHTAVGNRWLALPGWQRTDENAAELTKATDADAAARHRLLDADVRLRFAVRTYREAR